MCIIVYKNKAEGKFIDSNLKAALDYNPDGIGIMYPKYNGRMEVIKGLGSDAEKREMFDKHFNDVPKAALHLRYTTVGDTNLNNCHPFQVCSFEEDGVDLWMMHNGTIHAAPDYDEGMSDTYHFVEYYLRDIIRGNPDILRNSHFIDMVETYIDDSKLLFMDGWGHTVIVNEELGETVDECWLSNTYSIAGATRGSSKNAVDNWGWGKDDYDYNEYMDDLERYNDTSTGIGYQDWLLDNGYPTDMIQALKGMSDLERQWYIEENSDDIVDIMEDLLSYSKDVGNKLVSNTASAPPFSSFPRAVPLNHNRKAVSNG